jgi:hypothetical protein
MFAVIFSMRLKNILSWRSGLWIGSIKSPNFITQKHKKLVEAMKKIADE